jgi:catechol 2,3-dioxygenase-like lactoylglutathione lyase family enzyme
MAKVTGIGGVFFKVADPAATRAWYAKHLGLDSNAYGATLPASGVAVWNPFAADTTYFGPGDQPFMVNLKVDDLDALLVQLRADGIELVGEPLNESYGKFAWLRDCNGLKVELWQPIE